MTDMNIYLAPVQGHTDAPYRHFHSQTYGPTDACFTPFIRLERGEVRNRDLKDMLSPLNEGTHLIPQIIFRDSEELTSLTRILKDNGAKEIDLNMGCPFPLQTGHHRGAATVADESLAKAVTQTVEENPDITFSVKMRLGMKEPGEWPNLISSLNSVSLSHITVHPRVARQQYDGELDLDEFSKILEVSSNPVVFNGDITTLDDAAGIIRSFPTVKGLMLGRGLLGRPSLPAEIREGAEWPRERRIETMLAFHRMMLSHYESTLCGESQLLSKIKPFWEYAEAEIGRKAWKAIKKASNIAKYHSAIALIEP